MLLFFIGFANFAYGQYSLALHLTKGANYFLKINSTNHFAGEIDGKKMEMNLMMSGTMEFTVLGVTDSGYELGASYDTVHFALKGPMGQLEYSTGKGAADGESGSGTPSPIIGKQIHLTLLKNGAVSRIEHPDTAGFSGMFRNFPMAKAMKQMLMGSFKKSFSRETIKENLEKMTAIFPNKKVGLNESWGSTIKPDSNTDNSIKIDYRLVSYESGIAVIKGHTVSKGVISHKDKAAGSGMMPPATGDFQEESESTIQINTLTGWIKEANIKNEIKAHIQIKNKSDAAMKETPLQLNGDLTISGY